MSNTVCAQCDVVAGGERDFGIGVLQSFPCSDNIWDFIKRGERSGPVEQTVWLYGEEVRFGKHQTVLYSSTVI